MRIFGAGMAGLLAANVLRRHSPVVFESKKALPNNHSALLRFKTDVCSRATGIPFEKVVVRKAMSHEGRLHSESSIACNNMYSAKVVGTIGERSIINLEAGERYIAPSNFIEQMAASVDIKFEPAPLPKLPDSGDRTPCISTIPMPVMMKHFGWNNIPKFEWRNTWVLRGIIPKCNIHQTIYFPAKTVKYYRASIVGNLFILEYSEKPADTEISDDVDLVMMNFGIYRHEFPIALEPIVEQPYGKIAPIPSEERRKFMTYLTDCHNIYSLGRFATWRQILLDDVVRDIHQIERMITCKDGYSTMLEKIKV